MILIVVYFVIGIIFALICSGMARRRGRDGAIWGILGFFFGLIPVLVLAVAGSASTGGVAVSNANSSLDELAKLTQLMKDGALTEEEFEAQKVRLLGHEALTAED